MDARWKVALLCVLSGHLCESQTLSTYVLDLVRWGVCMGPSASISLILDPQTILPSLAAVLHPGWSQADYQPDVQLSLDSGRSQKA